MALQIGKELLCFTAVDSKVGGNNFHIIDGTHSFFLLLNLHTVEVGNLSLNGFNGFPMVYRLNVPFSLNSKEDSAIKSFVLSLEGASNFHSKENGSLPLIHRILCMSFKLSLPSREVNCIPNRLNAFNTGLCDFDIVGFNAKYKVFCFYKQVITH